MTWMKATRWFDDQHLKQGIRSWVEDPKDQAKSKHEKWNQAGRNGREETEWTEHHRELRTRGDEGPDHGPPV